MDGRGQVPGRHDEIGPLGANRGDRADVALLECFGPQHRAGDLPGDGNHGDRIRPRPHYSGHQVRRARTGGGDAHARLSGNPGVSIGGVGGGLLVADQDMPDLGIAPKRIIERQDRAAGVAENYVHAFPEQAFTDDL